MLKPAFEIRLVKENLDLSMALWQAVQEQKVAAKQLFRDGSDDMVVAFSVDNAGPDQQELTRRAANQARAAFALSVIQVQRSLERVFSGSPLDEENPDLQAARCVMFLLHNTISTDIFTPVWDCPPEYRRRFEVRPINLLMDAGELHGRGLSWEHVGGMPQYLDLLVYFADWVEELAEIEKQSPTDLWENAPEDRLEPVMVLVNPEPAEKIDGPVAQFVAERCHVGDGNLVLAKDLYSGFQDWCRETGQDDVSQRSFGMQLTAMGFRRRRRGRGKHWWDGIRLIAVSAPVMEETLVGASPAATNGHYGGYQTELPT